MPVWFQASDGRLGSPGNTGGPQQPRYLYRGVCFLYGKLDYNDEYMNEVEEVKARLDMVDVIGGYVPIKQAGRNYKGLSPFKTEKTPSFVVSPEKGIWHDFSSGRGGDVITFVMEMEGLSFPETLEMLAKRAGVKLKPRKPGQAIANNKKSRLFEANDAAMRFYHLALSKNQVAKDYFLKSRGLMTEIIKNYKLGYAPDNWDALANYLRTKGFSEQELVESGLVAKRTKGNGVYDVFRGRVMFPVFDSQGRVVGFSARLLADEKAAKYINTPQTDIYNKSFAVYGLTQAKDAIRTEDRVVIVEGNMDVLALSNVGFGNVVASSGTALTEQQIRQLSRLTKNIAVCFDNDEAGLNATLRAIELAGQSGVRIDVISLNNAKDPDELVKKDPKLWQEAIKAIKYAPDYIIDLGRQRFDLSSATGKKQFISFTVPMLKVLSDDIEIQHYVKKVAQLIDSTEESIQKLLQKSTPIIIPTKTTLPDSEPKVKETKPKRRLTRQEKLEQELLELTLAFPQTRAALKDLELKQTSELHRSIFRILKNTGSAQLNSIVKGLPKEGNYVKILALRGEQQFADLSAHDIRLEAFTQVARIHEINRQLNKRDLARQIAEAESSGDTKLTKQLLKQYQELVNED